MRFLRFADAWKSFLVNSTFVSKISWMQSIGFVVNLFDRSRVCKISSYNNRERYGLLRVCLVSLKSLKNVSLSHIMFWMETKSLVDRFLICGNRGCLQFLHIDVEQICIGKRSV